MVLITIVFMGFINQRLSQKDRKLGPITSSEITAKQLPAYQVSKYTPHTQPHHTTIQP